MPPPPPAPSLPAPPALDTGSFSGRAVPVATVRGVINLLISGAPLANAFTRQQTNRSALAWPTAQPSGFSWLAELEQFPTITMGDGAYTVAVAKIGGIVDLSNELWADNDINLTSQLGTLLADSMSRDLDLGLLNGQGPPEPVGVLGVAPPVSGPDLLAAAAAARGEIADAGGAPDVIALSGAMLADADTTRAADGQLIYGAGGFGAAAGLRPVVVPQLPVPIVFDSSRCFLVVRDDATVDVSTDYHFNFDATSLRIKARVAAAIPDVAKSIRKLVIGNGGGTGGGGAEPAAQAARKAPAASRKS